MENLLKEYLRQRTESRVIERKLEPLIVKWCNAHDEWFSCLESYHIRNDMSFYVSYSAICSGYQDNCQIYIPKEYFLAEDKDKFIDDRLAAKRAEEEALAREEAEKRKTEEDRKDRETYEKLKKKFDKRS